MSRKTLLIAILVLLPSCGELINKRYVSKQVAQDEYGEEIAIYETCQGAHLLNLDPYCKIEVQKPKYCYRTLGQVDCYDQPQRDSQIADDRRVK